MEVKNIDYIKVAEKKIDELTEFLQHNINLGYITRETTVDELFMLLENIREGYLPLQRDIDELLQDFQLKGGIVVNKIPTPITKLLSLPNMAGFDIYDKFAYLIKSVDGDSYYFYEQLPEEGFISEELGCEVYEAIIENVTYKDIFNWYKNWELVD